MGPLNRDCFDVWADRDCTWLEQLNGGRWVAEVEVSCIVACVVRLAVGIGFEVGIEEHKLAVG